MDEVDDDETPVATALREAREEVGIDPDVGARRRLAQSHRDLALGSAIWPVVGFLNERPEFTIDPAEVDRAFTVALRTCSPRGRSSKNAGVVPILRPGADEDGYFPIYFYRVPGDLIWGATARVVTELLCVVTGVDWPEAKRAWPVVLQ